jgi:mRNA interferase HigB
MRIVARRSLREFWLRHPDAEQALRAWYHDVQGAAWHSPTDIKRVYSNASILGENRVVFNINWNRYCLVAAINYGYQICYIRFVGTHSEYDRINAKQV